MNDKNIKLICKWASVILVILSMLVLMSGGMKIADKKDLRKFKKTMDTEIPFVGRIEDLDEDDIDDLQDMFDEFDIDFDAKQFVKYSQKTMDVMDDGKISIKEAVSIIPATKKMIKALEDNEEISENFDEEDFETIKKIKSVYTLVLFAFYLTLIIGIAVIVLHVIDNKLPGISITVINIIWVIAIGVAVNKLNIFLEDEMEADPGFFKMTAGPVWGVLFALMAMLLWMFKDKIAKELIGRGISVPTIRPAIGNTYSANTNTQELNAAKCQNCGNVLNPGAVFCPSCGTKYEAPQETVQPDEANIEKENTEEVRTTEYCPNCGAEFDSDAIFCGNCGYKKQ